MAYEVEVFNFLSKLEYSSSNFCLHLHVNHGFRHNSHFWVKLFVMYSEEA